jgi:ubiquinone/menaquinone biosynthesis C-methylase UbiE
MYNTESYWDVVAEKLDVRKSSKMIAGDNEPYYRYKRNQFLKLLDKVDFKNKKILEIGSGPGGNLEYLYNKGFTDLTGADISSKMVKIAKEHLKNKNIDIQKTNGITLPFNDLSFDLVFTSTVLQHNTNEEILIQLINNICKISRNEVVIFERIEKRIKGHESNLGRPISYYASLFAKNNLLLVEVKFLQIQVSYIVCGIIRKLFNSKYRKEGEQLSKFSVLLETISLPITKMLDKIFVSNRDVAMLRFIRN